MSFNLVEEDLMDKELGRQAETAVHHVTVGGDQGVLDEEPLQLSLSGPGVLSRQVYKQNT